MLPSVATACEEGKPFYDLPVTSPAAQEMDRIFTSTNFSLITHY